MTFKRIPRHIGIIPDGNRRWALAHGYGKQDGYAYGVSPGVSAVQYCQALGVEEMTFYGFTTDNTKRPTAQKIAFQKACVAAVMALTHLPVDILVIGNTQSPAFPAKLKAFATKPVALHGGGMRVNFLINYSWNWDLRNLSQSGGPATDLLDTLASCEISRMDLIIRWGGRRRLSGFLPVQSIYADFFVVDDYWPDYRDTHITEALSWYQEQDITLGG